MKHALPIAWLALTAAGCASARATAPAVPVALEVPPPPPRVIEPLMVEAPPEIEPVQPLAPQPETQPPPRRAQPRPQAAPAAQPEVKPETPPEQPVQAPAPAVPPLRTPGAGDGPEVERQVRDMLGRADKSLRSVDYTNLSQPRKLDYDTAKNFIKQAEDSLKSNNPVLARSLAEKAEKLASLLVAR